jgi:hypothetical protein
MKSFFLLYRDVISRERKEEKGGRKKRTGEGFVFLAEIESTYLRSFFTLHL